MLKAKLKNGAIIPLGPLPAQWKEGMTLDVKEADDSPIDIDEWAKSMNQLCADSTARDEQAMREAIDAHRQQAKAQVRRGMGLSA